MLNFEQIQRIYGVLTVDLKHALAAGILHFIFFSSLIFKRSFTLDESHSHDKLSDLEKDISCTRSNPQKFYFCDWNIRVS